VNGQVLRLCLSIVVNGPTWKRLWLTSTALIQPLPPLYHVSRMMITWTNWALFNAVNATLSVRTCGDELLDVTTEHHNVVDNQTLWHYDVVIDSNSSSDYLPGVLIDYDYAIRYVFVLVTSYNNYLLCEIYIWLIDWAFNNTHIQRACRQLLKT